MLRRILNPWSLFFAALLTLCLGIGAASAAGPDPSALSSLQASSAARPGALVPARPVDNPATRAALLQRSGIGQVRRPINDYVRDGVEFMHWGWYMDWNVRPQTVEPLGMEYVPLVTVKQWKVTAEGARTDWCYGCAYLQPYAYTVYPSLDQIRSAAAARPGMLWLIGNEIESRDVPSSHQDEMLPELYAQAYHSLATFIKSIDPTARLANGSLMEITPLRLQYLDRVWNEYQRLYGGPMPVDVWNTHLYLLPEKSCSAYPTDCWGAGIPAGLDETLGIPYSILENKEFSKGAEQVVAFRAWMREHGQQNKPLVISEFGVLMPDYIQPYEFTPAEIRDHYLYPTLDWFATAQDAKLGQPGDDYRLVQRWSFYSLDDDTTFQQYGYSFQTFSGNLFYSGLGNHKKGMSDLGVYYAQYVQSLLNGERPWQVAAEY